MVAHESILSYNIVDYIDFFCSELGQCICKRNLKANNVIKSNCAVKYFQDKISIRTTTLLDFIHEPLLEQIFTSTANFSAPHSLVRIWHVFEMFILIKTNDPHVIFVIEALCI